MINTIKTVVFSVLLFFIVSCSVVQQGGKPVSEREIGLNVGDLAPNIDLEDPDGFNRQLRDLKGKMVLVDFWASWCGPCRAQNPLIVGAYQRYSGASFKNGDGFDVFSVSLDENRDRWVRAIENDGLVWPNHVSDLDGNNSYVVPLYELNEIPVGYLIDGDGVILKRDVSADQLDRILQKYLK